MNTASALLRARSVEVALTGGASLEEASAVADKVRADANYRRHLCRALVGRVLDEVAKWSHR